MAAQVPPGSPTRCSAATGSGRIRPTPTTLRCLGQGVGDLVTGEPAELDGVKGSGGTRHADHRRPGRTAAGPAPRADRGVPGSGARGRDGGRVRLLPARQRWCGAVHRHGHARAGGREARGSPAPGLRDRVRHRGRRRGTDPGLLRGPGAVGAVAAARLPARPGHRGGGRRAPRGHRGDIGRSRITAGARPARSAKPTRPSSPTPRTIWISTARPSRSGR